MKVLIAEDEMLSRHLLQSSLARWGYEVVATSNGEEALAVLNQPDHPRMAILDWMMPKLDGIAVCREVRAQNLEPYIYLVLLTAKEGKQAIVDGIEAGADDFVAKPFDPAEVRARLRAGQRIVELQAQLLEARQRLQIQATHDPLTGLWNRAAIFDALNREWSRVQRTPAPIALVLGDVDHFKKINDSLGHLAGDEVLRVVANRLRQMLRPYDAVGRYGGEEFLILAPNCDARAAVDLANRLRVGIAAEPVAVGNNAIPVTMSLGVAVVTAGEVPPVEAVIHLADTALYRAKDCGRNRVEIARQTACEHIQ